MANWRNLLFLTLFALIQCITSSSIDKDCAKGVPFWCEHVMNAKRCNAVNFCIQSVWLTHDVKIDNNPLCDDCKDWVKQARDLIANKQNSDAIIKSLEYSCQLCPDENGRSKCKQLIEDNVNEIFKLLNSAMNPDSVCSAIHLCNNPSFTEMFANHPKKNHQQLLPFTCGQCSVIGSYLERKFKALNHDEALEGTLKFCGETSSFSDSCMNVVLKNFDDIHSQLNSKITRQNLCHATCAGHNQYSEGIVDIEPAFVDSELPCKLCEQLMLHLRELFIANTTEVEFKNILEGFCSQIPAITDACISITEQYYDQIYRFLAEELDASKTCVMIGVCTSQRVYKSPSMPLLSGEAFLPLNHKSEIIYNENSIKLQGDGKWCTACEYAMNFIHEEMGKNTVEDKIVEYARKSCLILPKFVKQCEETMDTFGDEIANAIYHGTDPRLICPAAKLCPPNFDLDSLEKNAKGEKVACPFCLFAIQEIKDVIRSNNTRDNIEKALDKLCDHLSENLKAQCESFVKTYSPDIIDMMLANFTPQEACVFIKLCNKNPPAKLRAKIGKLQSSSESDESSDFSDSSSEDLIANPQCDLCKEIIKILESRVIDIKSKDEIRRKLEESCSHMKRFSKECKSFVDKYSDRIVDLVSKELEPEQVCRDLIFCVTQSQRDFQDYDMGLDIMRIAFNDDEDEVDISSNELEDVESNPGCVLCEFVIQKVEDDLNDKKTDEEIKATVKNICSKMPSTVSKQCNEFVDYYFDMIIALIETSPPAEVCNRMGLCPNKNLEQKFEVIKKDIYSCAVCRGVVESIDTIIEDPDVDTNLENLEEKICEKFAGKFKTKCHNLASTYGVAIINLLKNMTESDQICFKFQLCEQDVGGRVMLN